MVVILASEKPLGTTRTLIARVLGVVKRRQTPCTFEKKNVQLSCSFFFFLYILECKYLL